MRFPIARIFIIISSTLLLPACTTMYSQYPEKVHVEHTPPRAANSDVERKIASHAFEKRMPTSISGMGEQVVVVDPRLHAFGAYNAEGQLVYGGIATAGANWCPDIGRPCHTGVGTFRVHSERGEECRSSIYPKPHGGGLMPYCMFFNEDQALHGSIELVDGNASHGCVRLTIEDAEWLHTNFVTIGTKVVVKPY